MPEKPEVITVVKALKQRILENTIKDVDIYWDNVIAFPNTLDFKRKIKNQTIHDITTRGKWLIFHLDDYVLLIHLRMEGKFTFRKNDHPINKHEHVAFYLNEGIQMRFHDVRKFGKILLLNKQNYLELPPLNAIGYEYDDRDLTKEYLFEKLNKKAIPIKTSLLDQSIIAGIGNIYADEILFLSEIDPKRKSNSITINECQSIIDNTKKVLDKAIKLGGTTIKSFTSSEGVHGLFQNELLVHGKRYGICPICKNEIVVIKINGRSTYFCSKCQK